jgi:hypothetical protein
VFGFFPAGGELRDLKLTAFGPSGIPMLRIDPPGKQMVTLEFEAGGDFG